MAERPKLIREAPQNHAASDWKTIPTGSTLLDLALNGGWAFGRVINVIGDSSAGKTLIAIEAVANYARKYSLKNARYNEAENAFSRVYAESIGLPIGLKFTGDDKEKEEDRHGSPTVEAFQEDFEAFLKSCNRSNEPLLYILDSFDALEAEKELKRDFGDRQPGAKAALSSEFYRTHIGDIAKHDCLLMIISQVREAIGVMFGDTKVRSGGKSHDFFCSQIVWLSTGRKITGKVAGVEQTIGVHTKFNVKKNKLGKPYGSANLVIRYNYGIDNEVSNIEWLKEARLGAAGHLTIKIDEYAAALEEIRQKRDVETHKKMSEELDNAVRIRWQEIDAAAAPPMKKYGELA